MAQNQSENQKKAFERAGGAEDPGLAELLEKARAEREQAAHRSVVRKTGRPPLPPRAQAVPTESAEKTPKRSRPRDE